MARPPRHWLGLLGLALTSASCRGPESATPDAAAPAAPSTQVEAAPPSATLDGGMTDPDAGDASLEHHARALAEAIAKQDWSAVTRDFTLQMRLSLGAAQLETVWRSIVEKTGARRSVLETRRERQASFDVVFVTCQHERGLLDIKVVYDAERKVAGLFIVPAWEPPEYAKPGELDEKEVVVGAPPWPLPATLTLPRGSGAVPAVVLVHGSGPNDRDETIGPNRPFKDLAWGLGSRGVAVLRYEKRTKVHAARLAGDARLTVKEETVDDALAAVELLRKTERIDASRIFVLGHSLGGQLLPRVGARDPKLAGLIILAGSNRPLHEVMLEQVQYIAALDGKTDYAEKQQIEALRSQTQRVEALKKSGHAASDTAILGAPPGYWLDLLAHDAPTEAKQLTLPLLVLQGERDYQVTMKDFARWKQALARRKNARFASYPNLNHLFIAGVGKSGPAEYQVPGHVAREVVDEIARFVGEARR